MSLDAHAQFKRHSLPQLRGFQKIPQRKSFGKTEQKICMQNLFPVIQPQHRSTKG